MKTLIIGLGFGNLYVDIYKKMSWEVYTLDQDINKNPNFKNVDQVFEFIKNKNKFDTIHICVPNYLHEYYAMIFIKHTNIMFIEKPGLKTAKDWKILYKIAKKYKTKLLMTKNNQYRNNIDEMKLRASKSKKIEISWKNLNRTPNPGSWFTTRSLSWGGVSKDLMPHLLSMICVFEKNYKNLILNTHYAVQNYNLSDLKTTNYGVINPLGTHDVDDEAYMKFLSHNKEYICHADWQNHIDQSYIEYTDEKNLIKKDLFGYCPDDAYQKMIETAIKRNFSKIKNWFWWQKQYQQDLWIHQQLEKL